MPRLIDDTLVILDPPPERRKLISKREAAVAAALVVAIVTVAGVVAFRPHPSPAAATLPILGVLPTFPSSAPATTAAARPSATRSATPRPTPPAQTTTAPAPVQSSTQAATGITVTYRVVNQWSSGFEGEVSVVNDEPSSISGWSMAIALPDDTFTAWWNATGYMSNGILVLSQPSYQGPVAADGGTLRVFFVVSGDETTPAECAFNNQDCTIGS